MIEEIGYGKVNLGLRIVRKRDDGYHEIDTVFQSIGLSDTVSLQEAPAFTLTCSDASLPCDATNLAYKAYRAICQHTGRHDGVAIHIEKQIPLAAGLAGGSADCAAVLRGLNRLWHLGLSLDELAYIGATLGADVPFCVYGGTMRGRGIGEDLTPVGTLPPWPVLVLHPHVPVRTQEAYGWFATTPDVPVVQIEPLLQAIAQADRAAVIKAMDNTFVYLVKPHVPEIGQCYDLLAQYGLRPLVSGSGPTVFAIVPPDKDAHVLYEALRAEAPQIDIYETTFVGGETANENS